MRKLACFCFSFACAVFLFCIFRPARFLWEAFICAVLAGAFLFTKYSRKKLLFLILFGFSAGLVYSGGYETVMEERSLLLSGLDPGVCRFVLSDDPLEKSYGVSLTGTAVSPDGTRVKAQLYIFSRELPELNPGTEIVGDFRFSDSTSAFGEQNTLPLSRGIRLIGQGTEVTVTNRREENSLRTFPKRLARTLSDMADRQYTGNAADFMKAVLLGDKSGFSDNLSLTQSLRAAGISHVAAVSGMHVSFLVGLFMFLIPYRKPACIASLFAIALFSALADFSPSVVRAGIMQSFVLVGFLLQREADGLTFLSLALVFLLLLNPYASLAPGLELSFAATLGILLFAGKIQSRLQGMRWVRKVCLHPVLKKILNFLISTVSASVPAILFTTPVSVYYFGTVSLVALPMNLLILWAVSLVFCLGWISLSLGFLWYPGSFLLSRIPGLLTDMILFLSRLAARLPLSQIYTDRPMILLWLVYTYGAILTILLCKAKARQMLLPLCGSGVLLCLALVLQPAVLNGSGLKVTALDVGQGQCIVLEARGHAVVYDCGGDGEEAGDTAADYLLSRGYSQVDLLILSHYDKDHVCGVGRLCDRLPVCGALLPDTASEGGNGKEATVQILSEYGTDILLVSGDMTVTVGECRLFLLTGVWPLADGENDHSLVLWANDGEFDCLLCGDLSVAGEEHLLRLYSLPKIEVLVAGHHGAGSSTGEAFLQTLQPEEVMISVGKNSYGHPGADTLDRIRSASAEILRTDIYGTVSVSKGNR